MIIDTGRDIPTLLVSSFGEDRMEASYALAKYTAQTAYSFLSREGIPAANDTFLPPRKMQEALAYNIHAKGSIDDDELAERLARIAKAHTFTR